MRGNCQKKELYQENFGLNFDQDLVEYFLFDLIIECRGKGLCIFPLLSYPIKSFASVI